LERLKILLSGMVAGDPHQGGATWAVLQYFASLRSLGHDVMLLEPLSRADSLDPDSEVVHYFRSLPLVGDNAALLLQGTDETLGLSYTEISKFAASADLLLNISGMLRDERLLAAIPVRAFLDLDPGFNQVWHATGEDMGLELHTHHVTVGLALGRESCPIPTCGLQWIHTLPPVALDLWPAGSAIADDAAFTTVAHWRSYGSIDHDGLHYGQRAHSLRELIELPRVSDARFQLALGIHPDEEGDLAALRVNGWELVDPLVVAGTPQAYREFVRGSKAELSVAKSGYVASRSGWFSDRSACYLASGRPVVAQDTGFGDFLPVGEGLLTFTTTSEAAEAVAKVESDWDDHSRAARMLAEEHLDSRKVVPKLLDRLAN
jgi:hypothetical protein